MRFEMIGCVLGDREYKVTVNKVIIWALQKWSFVMVQQEELKSVRM